MVLNYLAITLATTSCSHLLDPMQICSDQLLAIVLVDMSEALNARQFILLPTDRNMYSQVIMHLPRVQATAPMTAVPVNWTVNQTTRIMVCTALRALWPASEPLRLADIAKETVDVLGDNCSSGECMTVAENSRFLQGSGWPSGLQCRPTHFHWSGASNVEMVCMKDEDARGIQCSAERPCQEHISCVLQHETNTYCERNGTCGLNTMSCESGSQCCSGFCKANLCQW